MVICKDCLYGEYKGGKPISRVICENKSLKMLESVQAIDKSLCRSPKVTNSIKERDFVMGFFKVCYEKDILCKDINANGDCDMYKPHSNIADLIAQQEAKHTRDFLKRVEIERRKNIQKYVKIVLSVIIAIIIAVFSSLIIGCVESPMNMENYDDTEGFETSLLSNGFESSDTLFFRADTTLDTDSGASSDNPTDSSDYSTDTESETSQGDTETQSGDTEEAPATWSCSNTPWQDTCIEYSSEYATIEGVMAACGDSFLGAVSCNMEGVIATEINIHYLDGIWMHRFHHSGGARYTAKSNELLLRYNQCENDDNCIWEFHNINEALWKCEDAYKCVEYSENYFSSEDVQAVCPGATLGACSSSGNIATADYISTVGAQKQKEFYKDVAYYNQYGSNLQSEWETCEAYGWLCFWEGYEGSTW